MQCGIQRLNTYSAELLERELSVAVFVADEYGLVDDLLQLGILEVVADHQLQRLEKLHVGDEAVVVLVVHLERNCRAYTCTVQWH